MLEIFNNLLKNFLNFIEVNNELDNAIIKQWSIHFNDILIKILLTNMCYAEEEELILKVIVKNNILKIYSFISIQYLVFIYYAILKILPKILLD